MGLVVLRDRVLGPAELPEGVSEVGEDLGGEAGVRRIQCEFDRVRMVLEGLREASAGHNPMSNHEIRLPY